MNFGNIEFSVRALLPVPNYGLAHWVINAYAYIIIIKYLSLYLFPCYYSYIVRTTTNGQPVEHVFSAHKMYVVSVWSSALGHVCCQSFHIRWYIFCHFLSFTFVSTSDSRHSVYLQVIIFDRILPFVLLVKILVALGFDPQHDVNNRFGSWCSHVIALIVCFSYTGVNSRRRLDRCDTGGVCRSSAPRVRTV